MKYKRLLIYVPVVVTIALFGQILGHDFLYRWDDQWVVINVYTNLGLNLSNLWDVMTTFYHGQYAPFNELAYMTVHEMFGYNPGAFHAMSLLLHVGNVMLVYVFLRKLLDMNNIGEERQHKRVAWLASLIFGIHPVTVESVVWVSASKILVYSFFYLLALILYLDYTKKPTTNRYIGLMFLFTASFFGKEQAVVFPLCLILIDWFSGRDVPWRQLLLEKVPFFVMALFFGIVNILSQGHSESMPEYAASERFFFGSYSLFEYMLKAMLPVNLSYVYPFPCQPGDTMPTVFYIYPLIIISIAFLIYMFRSQRIIIFSSLFFLIHILVALHIIPMSRFTIVADRYNYMSLIGCVLFISWCVVSMMRYKKTVTLALTISFLVYLGDYTNMYTKQWKNSETLKQHVKEVISQRGDK